MSLHSIYALRDPDTGLIRYIGRTSKLPYYRLAAHIVSAGDGVETPLGVWLRQLIESNKLPGLVVIKECGEDEVHDLEKHWIKMYRGDGNLLNVHNNGDDTAGHRRTFDWSDAKSIGIPEDLHARIKRMADDKGMSIVQLIEASVDLWERWSAVQIDKNGHSDDAA